MNTTPHPIRPSILLRTGIAGAFCLALAMCGHSDRALAVQPDDPPMAGPRAHAKKHKADGEGKRGLKAARGDGAPRGAGAGAFDEDRPLPPEVIERVMEVIQEKLPERYDRLIELRERNPERFERLIRRMAPMMREYRMLRDRDEEMAETIIHEFRNQALLHDLSRAYKEAAGDAMKQAEIEQEMAALVRNQMEFLHQRMEFRLKDMEERLTRQQEFIQRERARLTEAKANIEQRLAERIEEIKQGKVAPDHPPFKRGLHRGERRFGEHDADAPRRPREMRGDRPRRGPPPPPDDDPEDDAF